ncbi:MAG: sugar transferase [Pseudomonadota bacterium]
MTMTLMTAPTAGRLTTAGNGERVGPKRLFDVLLSGLALILLLPVFLVTALVIALTSRGPVFYVQDRIGLEGTRFRFIKFRSMYKDAGARRAALLADSDREGITFKQRADPRITPVGRVLRRTSIDELPQLINVLRGDMSLVGPRPGLPEEVAAYPPRAMARLEVPPGITGIWQVSGRADIGFDEMIAMDLDYVERASLPLDLKILLQTVRAVISGRGAY